LAAEASSVSATAIEARRTATDLSIILLLGLDRLIARVGGKVRVGRWTADARRPAQLPDTDRDERQDEGREQNVGERPVAGRDERNEAEAAGNEHAADEQPERDEQARAMRQRFAAACHRDMIDPLIDRVDRARPTLQQ